MGVLVLVGQGVVRESPTTPGQKAKKTVTGSTRNTTGTANVKNPQCWFLLEEPDKPGGWPP